MLYDRRLPLPEPELDPELSLDPEGEGKEEGEREGKGKGECHVDAVPLPRHARERRGGREGGGEVL